METIEQALAATRMFHNVAPEQLRAIAELGREVEFAGGATVLREGDPADSFSLIRDGFVALQIQATAGAFTIETLHNGDPVGWSWLFEPYLAHFDARSRGVTRAIRFDAAELRRRCAEDPKLGCEVTRSFTSVIVGRLNATWLQLLDVWRAACPPIASTSLWSATCTVRSGNAAIASSVLSSSAARGPCCAMTRSSSG